VFYGTPLQSEEAESKRQHEFQKRDVRDAAGVKALPVWQQASFDPAPCHTDFRRRLRHGQTSHC